MMLLPACRNTTGLAAVAWPRRGLLQPAVAILLSACAAPAPPKAQAASFALATDVLGELTAGAVLVDVRGPTERAQDGVPGLRHHWVAFGPDRWRGRPSEAETQDFPRQISHVVGPPGARLLILCSVGIRSEAAARLLLAADYDANGIMDGWLGNDMGAGLRAAQR